jgi:hypothetical protein
VQDPEAVDEVKALLDPSSANASIREYSTAEPSRRCTARKPSAPSSSMPHRDATRSRWCSFSTPTHPLGPPPLGEKRVKPVEAADIEHAHPGDVLGNVETR